MAIAAVVGECGADQEDRGLFEFEPQVLGREHGGLAVEFDEREIVVKVNQRPLLFCALLQITLCATAVTPHVHARTVLPAVLAGSFARSVLHTGVIPTDKPTRDGQPRVGPRFSGHDSH